VPSVKSLRPLWLKIISTKSPDVKHQGFLITIGYYFFFASSAHFLAHLAFAAALKPFMSLQHSLPALHLGAFLPLSAANEFTVAKENATASTKVNFFIVI
jgi:hypothetical protein